MPDPTMPEEYAELMKHNGHEHYLYTPQRYSKLHPGSVGFFDKYGFWNQITDLSQPGYPDDFSFKDIGKVLSYDEPTEYMWDAVSSGNEAGSSFGLNGGLSGMLAAAPVDAEANASNKRGSSGTAALITTQSVKNQRLEGGSSRLISDWVKKNGKMLMKSNYGDDIRGYGLWVIHTTWSTECAIKMNSAFHRNTSAGLDLGATDVGKVGGSGSSLKKLESNGWKSYQATEPLKQAERVSDPPARHFEYNEKQETIGISIGVMVRGANGDNHWVPSSKEEFIFDENRKLVGKVYWNRISDEYGREISWVPYHRENYIFDEDGEKTGAAYFRPTRGSTREQIEWEQYDKDAEEIDAKKKETEMANQARREYEDQDEFEIECETVGMDDNEYDTKAVERTETTPLMSKCCVM